MRGALEGRVAAPAAAPAALVGQVASPLLLGAVGVLLAAALLRGGGSGSGALFWIGAGAVLAAGAAATAAALGRAPRPRLPLAGVALLLAVSALTLWIGATVVWSIQPDRTWDSFNRAAVYLALLVLGVVVGSAVREAPAAVAAILAAVVGATVLWALAGAVIPALGPDVERSARLREPVEYWNALALAIAMGLPLWLWLARRVQLRPVCAVALFASGVALLLTGSRGGLIVAVVAVGVWLLLARAWNESAPLLLVAGLPALAVGGWALTSAVAEAGADGRGTEGAVLGVLLVAGGALVAWIASRPLPAVLPRVAAGAAVAAGVALLVVAAVRGDEWWAEFRNPPAVQVSNDPGRLADPSSNHRWTWWTQAWTIFRADELTGAGAGAYELARRPIREDTSGPLDPHNLFVKALAETGIVGFLLLLAAVAAAAWACVVALRRTSGEERAATIALVAACCAWLAQALFDMPWEYVAVSAPLFVALGVVVAAGSRGEPRRAGLVAIAAPAAVAVALLLSLVSPWLAERRAEAALDALVDGDPVAAADASRSAQSLNPLAVRPLHLEAIALESEGRLDAAQERYEEAVRLQPENGQTWYELGRFEYEARRDAEDALVYLDRSWGLDRQSPDTGPLLDRVRAELAAQSK